MEEMQSRSPANNNVVDPMSLSWATTCDDAKPVFTSKVVVPLQRSGYE